MAQRDWHEGDRKRGREDDYADVTSGGTLGFTEHRSKRMQALPLRTSPQAKRWQEAAPDTAAMYPSFGESQAALTPANSDTDDSSKHFRPESHAWGGQQPSVPIASTDMDADMDMMDTSDQLQAPEFLQPGHSQPDHAASNITGRMPTPIHCSFATQLRGNNWGGGAGNIMASSPMKETHDDIPVELPNGLDASCYGCQGRSRQDHIPRTTEDPTAAMENWNMVQNRRLPSPISETGGEEVVSSPGMVLDSSAPMGTLNHHGHQHPMLDSLPPRATSALELGQAHQPPREGSPTADGTMDLEDATTPSPRKGHTRSRHTLNSWTALQPGMKRTFSIGYRTDCDMCRQKVPGHFNHIIIS